MAVGYFGQNFLQGAAEGFFGGQNLRDYTHASKTFTTNGYGLLPRQKFLFHVYFNINTGQIPALNAAYSNGVGATIGLMVKTVELPSYSIDVQTLNQYNRKRLMQTKINYQPVQITFHDDNSDLIRNLWYQYYSYYYKDPTYPYNNIPNQNGTLGQVANESNGFGYNVDDIYSASRPNADWGYIGESYQDGTAAGPTRGETTGKPNFFTDIQIYGLAQKKYAEYTLINPMITDWKSEPYDYSSDNGTMSHTMTIRYETVKYYAGAVGGTNPSTTVNGFADPSHYDTAPSPLARPGSQSTVFGQGGLVDAVAGFATDLQAGNVQGIIGAAQIAGTTYNTFKNKSIGNIAQADVLAAAPGVIQNSLPGATRQALAAANGMLFPKAPVNGG